MATTKRKTREAEPHEDRRQAIAAVSERFKQFRTAREELRRVRAVPTIFTQLDYASKIGGLPIERFMLVHGPSAGGKTSFVLGLIKSFLMRDHYAYFIDAERSTPIEWPEKLLGEYVDHPGFYALRPESYEATIKQIREWLLTIVALREEGKIHAETSAIVVVDSIRKLVPKGILDTIMNSLKGGGAKRKGKDIGGRAAQIKAAMNSQWMDETVPLLEKAGAGMVVIARETEDPDADQWKKATGQAFKVGGGAALYYDASLVARVERSSFVTDKKSADLGEGEKAKVFGERNRVTIRKTKVSGRDEDKQTTCFFHTSNGVLIPEGFDTARDVLELAEKFDLVKAKGTWLTWGKQRWQGRHAAVRKLVDQPELLHALEHEVRSHFAKQEPEEYDPETGEVV